MSKEDEEYWKCFKNNMIWGISENSQEFWFLVPQWWRSIYVENLETLRQHLWGSNFELGDWANPVSWDSDTGWGTSKFHFSVSWYHSRCKPQPWAHVICGHTFGSVGCTRWRNWESEGISEVVPWPCTGEHAWQMALHLLFPYLWAPDSPVSPALQRGEGSPSPRREKQVSVFLPRSVLWKAVQRFLSLWWGYILINPVENIINLKMHLTHLTYRPSSLPWPSLLEMCLEQSISLQLGKIISHDGYTVGSWVMTITIAWLTGSLGWLLLPCVMTQSPTAYR